MLRRKGYCSRCGECCKTDNPYKANSAAEPCSKLELVGPDNYACGLWRTSGYFMQACYGFPYRAEDIKDMPECTYYFVEDKSAGRIREAAVEEQVLNFKNPPGPLLSRGDL